MIVYYVINVLKWYKNQSAIICLELVEFSENLSFDLTDVDHNRSTYLRHTQPLENGQISGLSSCWGFFKQEAG